MTIKIKKHEGVKVVGGCGVVGFRGFPNQEESENEKLPSQLHAVAGSRTQLEASILLEEFHRETGVAGS
jgi:hypothetical protein